MRTQKNQSVEEEKGMRRERYRIQSPEFQPKWEGGKLGLARSRDDKEWNVHVKRQRIKFNGNSKSSYYCSGRCGNCDGRSTGKSWAKEKDGYKNKTERCKRQVM